MAARCASGWLRLSLQQACYRGPSDDSSRPFRKPRRSLLQSRSYISDLKRVEFDMIAASCYSHASNSRKQTKGGL